MDSHSLQKSVELLRGFFEEDRSKYGGGLLHFGIGFFDFFFSVGVSSFDCL